MRRGDSGGGARFAKEQWAGAVRVDVAADAQTINATGCHPGPDPGPPGLRRARARGDAPRAPRGTAPAAPSRDGLQSRL